MEERIKLSYEQGEQGSSTMLICAATGFGMFWAVFFASLLYDPFAAMGNPFGKPAIPLPVSMLLGFISMNLLAFRFSDFFSHEQGHRTLRAIVTAYGVVPAAVLLGYASGAVPMLSAFAPIAWLALGIGLGSLFALWSELLVAFTKKFASQALAVSACIGAALFFILCTTPISVNATMLCVVSPVSCKLLSLVEKEVDAAPYVTRAESLKRHKLSKDIDALNALYGVVFGVSIYGLAKIEPSVLTYGLIALALAIGSLSMIPILGKNISHMMHGRVQKLIFPMLVIGLLPLPLLNSRISIACLLAILVAYICLTLVSLDSLYCLVKRYKVSALYLVGHGHSPIMVGVAIGYTLSYIASITGIVETDSLFILSLVLVVLLSVFVTFINFDSDYLQLEQNEAISNAMQEAEAEREKREHKHTSGRWKAKVAFLAERHGLSARELEVFELLAKGRGTAYIQDHLYISPHTAKTHTYKIYKKLGVSSREELITLVEKTRIDR